MSLSSPNSAVTGVKRKKKLVTNIKTSLMTKTENFGKKSPKC